LPPTEHKPQNTKRAPFDPPMAFKHDHEKYGQLTLLTQIVHAIIEISHTQVPIWSGATSTEIYEYLCQYFGTLLTQADLTEILLEEVDEGTLYFRDDKYNIRYNVDKDEVEAVSSPLSNIKDPATPETQKTSSTKQSKVNTGKKTKQKRRRKGLQMILYFQMGGLLRRESEEKVGLLEDKICIGTAQMDKCLDPN